MKKIFFSALAVVLIFGFLNGPVQVGAASKSTDLVEPAVVYTKTVNELVVYSLTETIRSSIPYSANGWSGTLYLKSKTDAGDHYLVRYSGTVSCSGVCKMALGEVQ